MRRVLFILLAVILFGATGTVAWLRFRPAVAVATPATPPRRRPQPPRPPEPPDAPLPLAQLTPMPPRLLTPDRLATVFPAFHHEPFETAGFNPLALPFRYEDPDSVGDPAEANALAFLLSGDLDWAPGNYSARHAYFVFDRAGPALRGLARRYDPAVIAQQIADWTATHAVGGVLTRTRAGCCGTLQIFAADGGVEFEKRYPEPRPYFELLGDMSADAIAHFGPPPTAELAAFLHQPRCQHPESIVRLGLAAFGGLRSARTFDLYAQILQDDPTFAEVRQWWAAQKWWDLQDDAEDARQQGQALHDRLLSHIVEFNPENCHDRELASEYPAWVDRVEHLVGAQSPLTVRLRLRDAMRSDRFDPDLYRRSLRLAARYPNNQLLLDEVARSQLDNDAGPLDAELAGGICATAIRSRWLDAEGDHDYQWSMLADAAERLGQPDIASAARAASGRAPGTGHLDEQLKALCDAGDFAGAVARFSAAEPVPHDEPGLDAAHWVALAAAVVGDDATVAHLSESYAGPFEATGMATLLAAHTAAVHLQATHPTRPSHHDELDLQALQRDFNGHYQDPSFAARVAVAADIDLARRCRYFSVAVWQISDLAPNQRLWWVLLDRYQHLGQDTSLFGPCFYATLEWLHPGDPWVASAVADAMGRGEAMSTAKADRAINDVRAALFPFAPAELPSADRSRERRANAALRRGGNPWVVAGAIRALLDRGETAQAHEMALRFRHLTVDLRGEKANAFASELVARTRAR